MKKPLIYLLGLLALLLAACGGTNQAAPGDTPLPPGLTVAGQGSQSSVAQCTAQSQELADIVEPDDHVTGALEGYSVTILEFGDYQ